MEIGRTQETSPLKSGIKKDKGLKILGIYFGKKSFISRNFLNLKMYLEKESKRLIKLGKYFSFDDRNELINSYIVSKIMYICQIIKPSYEFVKYCQSVITNIFWAGKRHWKDWKMITLPKYEGGRAVPNIKYKLEAKYFERYLLMLYGDEMNIQVRMDRELMKLVSGTLVGTEIAFMNESVMCSRLFPPELKAVKKTINILNFQYDLPKENESLLAQPLYANKFLSLNGIELPSSNLTKQYISILEFLQDTPKSFTARKLKNAIVQLLESLDIYIDDYDQLEYVNINNILKDLYILNPRTGNNILLKGINTRMVYDILIEKNNQSVVKWDQESNAIYACFVPKRWSDIMWRLFNNAIVTPRYLFKIDSSSAYVCKLCLKIDKSDFHIFESCSYFDVLLPLKEEMLEYINDIAPSFLQREALTLFFKLPFGNIIDYLSIYVKYRIYGKSLANILVSQSYLQKWMCSMFKIILTIIIDFFKKKK